MVRRNPVRSASSPARTPSVILAICNDRQREAALHQRQAELGAQHWNARRQLAHMQRRDHAGGDDDQAERDAV